MFKMGKNSNSRLAGKFIRDLAINEENAKEEYNSIQLDIFLKDVILNCLNNSKSYANEVWKSHLKDLEDNYLQNERNNQQYKWEKKITDNYREDNSVYRITLKTLKKEKDYSNSTSDIKLIKIVDFIANHINDNIYSYRDRINFLKGFEKQVKESMLYEVLFKHLKRIERDDRILKNTNLDKEDFELVKKLVAIKIKELNTFNKVRYGIGDKQVTRVSYEGNQIANDLNDYNINFIHAYLEILKKEIKNNDIKIIDNLPFETPDVTNDFLNWIDKQLINIQLKENTKQKVSNENLHPKIFENGAFDIFVKWVNKSNDEQIKSISFIFQKLKKENKLRSTTFKVLSEWAYNNKYLDEENYNKLLMDGCFISPSKILTKSRLALYNSITGN